MSIFRNSPIGLALVLLWLIAGCGGSHPRVVIEEAATGRDVAAPMEIDGATLGLTNDLLQISPDGALLQAAPALFGAPDTARHLATTAYCALLPPGAAQGLHDLERASPSDAFTMSEEGGRLTLSEGDRPVLAYNFGTQLPEGLPAENARSTYVHPIWSPAGTVLTDDFPADHLHHRGLSWMWPRVFVDGKEYDVWALRGMHQVFDEWLLRETGPVCTTIGVKNHWEMMEDGRNVLDEWVWVRAFKSGTYGRALDIRLTLMAREPIDIAGRETDNKGYGGFSLRFAPREETVITSPNGWESEDSDHLSLPWADESGQFGANDEVSGMAIFQHDGHPDFPAKWTLRHYGFLGVAWPGVERRTLRPGEPVTLRYRVWVHEGDAQQGRVAAAYDVFADPPTFRAAH